MDGSEEAIRPPTGQSMDRQAGTVDFGRRVLGIRERAL